MAVLTNQSNIVKKLILAGVDPIIRNINGDTALHLAVRANNINLADAITQSIKDFGCIHYTNFKITLLQILEQRNFQGLFNSIISFIYFFIHINIDTTFLSFFYLPIREIPSKNLLIDSIK